MAEVGDEPAKSEAAQTIHAADFEETSPGELGPALTPDAEPAPQPPEQPTAAIAPQPAAQSGTPVTDRATAGPINKLAMLPEWLRRLPETTASKPQSTPSTSPAERSLADAAPTPQPKPALQPAPLPETAGSPQPSVEQKVNDSWQEPEALVASLNALAGSPASNWATAVLRQLAALKPAIAAGSSDAAAILDRLAELRNRQYRPARLPDAAFARRWREVGYALTRRIDIWRQVVRLNNAEASNGVSPTLDAAKLADCLSAVAAATEDLADAKGWQAFLLLDDLRRVA